jgi:hypothetical protein
MDSFPALTRPAVLGQWLSLAKVGRWARWNQFRHSWSG